MSKASSVTDDKIFLCSSIQRMSICACAFKFHHDDGLCTLSQSGGKQESVLVLCVSTSLEVAVLSKANPFRANGAHRSTFYSYRPHLLIHFPH